MKRFSVNAKGKSGEIWLYQEVGGYWDGVTAKQFSDELKKLSGVETINLHINSPGGDVFDGIAIYNMLKSHPASVVVDIDGLAASIASVVAMSGDEVRIAANGMMMIHDAWAFAVGNSSDMRKTAEMLDKVDLNIVDTYVKKSGSDSDKIKSLMSAETWMTSQEAKDLGLVDLITDELQMAAHFDLSKFRYKNQPNPVDLLTGDVVDKDLADKKNRIKLGSMNLKSSKMRRK